MPSTKFLTSPFILARHIPSPPKRTKKNNEMPKTNEWKLVTTTRGQIKRKKETKITFAECPNKQFSKNTKREKKNGTTATQINGARNADREKSVGVRLDGRLQASHSSSCHFLLLSKESVPTIVIIVVGRSNRRGGKIGRRLSRHARHTETSASIHAGTVSSRGNGRSAGGI
jgi:hypothetical protein